MTAAQSSILSINIIVHSFTMVTTLFWPTTSLTWLLLFFAPAALSAKIYLAGDSTMAKGNGVIQGFLNPNYAYHDANDILQDGERNFNHSWTSL
jgi:hypothetical protein